MEERLLNIKEIQPFLQLLKAIDLESADKSLLIDLIHNINKHVAIVGIIPVGTVICRSVSCNYLKDDPVSTIPLNVSQISFNPAAHSCGFNRASWEGESAFYGSISTADLESYYTCSFEVLADLQDSTLEFDRETFVIGKWIVQKEIQVVNISGNLKHNTLAVLSRYDTLYTSISKYPEYIVPLKMIDTFICNEFTKSVPSNEKWNYKISAAYAEIVKKDNWPGVILPSLKSEGAGYNVALFPEHLYDCIKLERAALSTHYKRGESICNEITMEAVPNGDTLIWRETYQHKMLPCMKKWYLGLSDDDSFQKQIPLTEL